MFEYASPAVVHLLVEDEVLRARDYPSDWMSRMLFTMCAPARNQPAPSQFRARFILGPSTTFTPFHLNFAPIAAPLASYIRPASHMVVMFIPDRNR